MRVVLLRDRNCVAVWVWPCGMEIALWLRSVGVDLERRARIFVEAVLCCLPIGFGYGSSVLILLVRCFRRFLCKMIEVEREMPDRFRKSAYRYYRNAAI